MAESTLLSAEQIGRFLVEYTNPDEMGLTDSRIRMICNQAISAIALREQLAAAEQYREKYLQLSAQHVREIEAVERALAEAQEKLSFGDPKWVKANRELKAELAKLRAPVGDIEAQVFVAWTKAPGFVDVVPADIARQLAARIALLELNDARYRWLRDTDVDDKAWRHIIESTKAVDWDTAIDVEILRDK